MKLLKLDFGKVPMRKCIWPETPSDALRGIF